MGCGGSGGMGPSVQPMPPSMQQLAMRVEPLNVRLQVSPNLGPPWPTCGVMMHHMRIGCILILMTKPPTRACYR
eukprot:9475816-Pyramimonas_sp.AAC.1